jgi:hypothetical protein
MSVVVSISRGVVATNANEESDDVAQDRNLRTPNGAHDTSTKCARKSTTRR